MKGEKLTLMGGVLTAFLTSACCTIPLALSIIGISGGAVAFTWLEKYRLPLTIISIALLGLSLYLAYRKDKTCNCETECEVTTTKKVSRISVWISAIVILFFVSFPYLQGSELSSESSFAYQETSKLDTVVIMVEGMTCGGCETTVERTLNEIEGIIKVSANYKTGQVQLIVEKTKRDYILTMAKSKITELDYKIISYNPETE